MSPGDDPGAIPRVRFPRVSGDEPWKAGFPFVLNEFSPRERG